MQPPLRLAYGKGFIELCPDPSFFDITPILPNCKNPLKNPEEVFIRNAKAPFGSSPLAELAKKNSRLSPRVTIVISDHTRPVPDKLLIPWIVRELGVDDSSVSILIGTGTHRGPSKKELSNMLGPDILHRFKIFIHDCRGRNELINVGKSSCGGPCLLHRRYVDADIRIATGFIEPHFFAGFSGGSKAIVPGIAGFETISYFHRARLIADPRATWGSIDHNPVLQLSRDMTALCPPDAVVNVTLNLNREITGIYIGNHVAAHASGCRNAEDHYRVPVPRKFPVVITTNSGYPLDMNFYQTVKGISAASTLVEEGGTIIAVSECGNGIPDKSEFSEILSRPLSTPELLRAIMESTETRQDQWQVQILLQILQKCGIFLFSALDEQQTRAVRVSPTDNIEKTLAGIRSRRRMKKLPVGVMPFGPLMIPAG